MINQSADRLEIFLALALRRETVQIAHETNFLPTANFENKTDNENHFDESKNDNFSAIIENLTKAEAGKFKKSCAKYQEKTAAEKLVWRDSVLNKIGTDEQLIDETVHWSHVNDALRKETVTVQKIIGEKIFDGRESKIIKNPVDNEKKASPLKKTIRRAFSRQFVSIRDLPKPTWFDRLNGAELARLIRLTGIREVALACVRIEAVESVAAFLRRFPAEDARATAAQLNNLRNTSEIRLSFAETLVQNALETEPQPSAMLDSLGISLIGILLCNGAKDRVRYTNQKLPLEASGKLAEIIDRHYHQTPADLQHKISVEIEQLADTIAHAAGVENHRKDKKF